MKLDVLIRNSAVVISLALAPISSPAHDRGDAENGRDDGGVVFTMDNAAAANHILPFHRGADGRLQPGNPIATGGRGTGSGLGSQGAIVLSSNGRWMFACNAGSDEISVFLVVPNGAVLIQKVASGGKHPISLALHHNSLFVLNAGGQVGGSDNIAGFVFFGGRLYPVPESISPLSAPSTNPAQVGFSSDGETLIVTEKDTGVIDTFRVDNDGGIDQAGHFQSSGQTPFGFAVRGDDLIVTEAFGGAPNASAASSYKLDRNGDLEVISPTVPTTETSACWVVVTASGRFAYTANTGSGTISGYHLGPDGSLTLLNADGVTGLIGPGSSPADLTLSVDGRFLYCRNGNGTISAFNVGANGALTVLSGASGLPSGTAGLVGR